MTLVAGCGLAPHSLFAAPWGWKICYYPETEYGVLRTGPKKPSSAVQGNWSGAAKLLMPFECWLMLDRMTIRQWFYGSRESGPYDWQNEMNWTYNEWSNQGWEVDRLCRKLQFIIVIGSAGTLEPPSTTYCTLFSEAHFDGASQNVGHRQGHNWGCTNSQIG